MDKNWLIRTKSNHILGPVSKDKVIELLNNNSLKSEDELCSANGYWFYVKEKELVEKYIAGNAQQTFNPISEAKDIISVSSNKTKKAEVEVDDITLISKNINIQALREDVPTLPNQYQEKEPGKKKITEPKTVKSPKLNRVHYKDSKKLQYILISLFILLASTIYFRKLIFRKTTTQFKPLNLIINTAHAQEEVKKKSFLKH